MDVDISIDTPFTGHTVWAVDALTTYMAAQASKLGPESLGQLWQRVWTGHHSLIVVSKPLLKAIALHLTPRLGAHRLKRLLLHNASSEA